MTLKLKDFSGSTTAVLMAAVTITALSSTGNPSLVCSAWVPTAASQQRRSAALSAPFQTPLHPHQRLPSAPLLSRPSLTRRLVATLPEELASEDRTLTPFPELLDDGIYNIKTKEEHEAFLDANRDKLIVLKVYAPWCRACKGLAPKFQAVARDKKYADLPIVWAQLTIQHNKEFVKSIGVLALPTVQFYVGGSISDTFPCGPSKVPILKRKLAQLVNSSVDAKTLLVKQEAIDQAAGIASIGANDTAINTVRTLETTWPSDLNAGATAETATPPSPPPAVATTPPMRNNTVETAPTLTTTGESAVEPLISMESRRLFRSTIPLLAKMSIADFDHVMDKARVLTFDAGSIIMREGKPGRTFYIIQEGEVEICQKTFAEDPMQLSGQYLGTVVNRLEKDDFFGERSLLTGEPRAASIRAVETTSCFAFDKDDFPHSSPLSGRTRNTAGYDDNLAMVDEKYGVSLGSLYAQNLQQQIRDANAASQIRGSVHKPNKIPGVDTDEDLNLDDLVEQSSVLGLPTDTNDTIFNVLRRFKLIRHVSKCFDYITLTKAKWGSRGLRKRRELLLSRLSAAQREEFAETFDLIDVDNNKQISLFELKRVMHSVGDVKSEEELLKLVVSSRLAEDMEERPELNKQDFMGVMAEAEFYFLFRDIFKSLDPADSGYVKAGDLDRILNGVRDLISDDRKSVIDVDEDDRDMLIDYEQFSRMLLGSSSLE